MFLLHRLSIFPFVDLRFFCQLQCIYSLPFGHPPGSSNVSCQQVKFHVARVTYAALTNPIVGLPRHCLQTCKCLHLPYTFDLSSSGGSAGSHAAVGITLRIISVNKPLYNFQVETPQRWRGVLFSSQHLFCIIVSQLIIITRAACLSVALYNP